MLHADHLGLLGSAELLPVRKPCSCATGEVQGLVAIADTGLVVPVPAARSGIVLAVRALQVVRPKASLLIHIAVFRLGARLENRTATVSEPYQVIAMDWLEVAAAQEPAVVRALRLSVPSTAQSPGCAAGVSLFCISC